MEIYRPIYKFQYQETLKDHQLIREGGSKTRIPNRHAFPSISEEEKQLNINQEFKKVEKEKLTIWRL